MVGVVVIADWCRRLGVGADSEIVMLVVLIDVVMEAMFGRDARQRVVSNKVVD
jgi:hypothetical protein